MSVLTTFLWGIPALASFALLLLLLRSQDRFAAAASGGWTRIVTGSVLFFVFCLTLFLLHLPVIEMLLGPWSEWAAIGAFLLFAAGLVLVIPAAVGWLGDMARMRTDEDKRISSVALTEDLLALSEQPYVLTELLTAGLRTMMEHSDSGAGMVWLLARDRVTLVLAGAHGFDKPAMKAAESVVTSGHELFDRALRGNQAVTAGDLSSRSRFLESFPGMSAFASVAIVPLSGGGEIIGMALLGATEAYHYGPELARSLAGAGRALGSSVSGQRLQRELQKQEQQVAEKTSALNLWEQTLGSGVPATTQTVLHGLADAIRARAAMLVPSGARFVPFATDQRLMGLPLDGIWGEATKAADERRKALWVNPGKGGSDPRNPFGRWVLLPTPAGSLFFAPMEEEPNVTAQSLSYLSRLAEIALLLAPPPELPEPERLLELAGQLADNPGSPETLAEVAAELVSSAEAVIVWQKDEGRLSIAAAQGCAAEPLAGVSFPVGQGTVGKAALAVQPLCIESSAEIGRSWAEYSGRERAAFAEAFGGLERPAAEYLVPVAHADLVLQLIRFTRGGWPETVSRITEALARSYKPKTTPTSTAGLPAPSPERWGDVGNDLNNLFTGILGQAELLEQKLTELSIPVADRQGLTHIINAAQSGGELVGSIQVKPDAEEEMGLNTVTAELLSGRHITDDLYLLPDNRAVQIRTELESTPSPVPSPQKLQSLLWTALSRVARDQGGVSVGTSADERYLYLAISGEETREPLKGPFGDFFRAPDSGWQHLLPVADLDFLRSVGAQIAADHDQEPQRMVVRFPYGTDNVVEPEHPGLNVLAIDDQEIIRDLLLNMFMGMGHRITVCKSGEDGLAALDSEQYDLVLTDLGMPGMSGWEVASAVKQRSVDIPVVLITGWGFNFAEEQVRKAGVDYVLTKPFRLEHLTEVVEAAVRRSPQVH